MVENCKTLSEMFTCFKKILFGEDEKATKFSLKLMPLECN